MRKVIFHIDVNSAYLSWEATRRVQNGAPDLRLIPSAIGGDRDKRTGVILAKSIPAKKYKITTGEPVGMALRKCPELVLAKPDFKLYVQCSRAFVAICRKYAPVVEQVSIDECFCDFDNTERIYPDPLELAYLIKDEIRDTLGFTVNVGVSENKLLAKMASDFEKPDKVQTLYPSEIAEKMWPLPVGELFTVGKATAERLKKARIETIGDLAHTDQTVLEEMLIKSLDLQGRVLLANGVNQDAVCEVRDAIRHFNEESKISNNYAASLNGVSVGELAAVRYFPTQEALEIQFFWEAAVNDASIVTSTEPTPPLPEDTPEAKAERYSILREKRQKEREEKEERCKAAKAAFEQREAAAKQNYDAVVEHLNARKQQFRRELDAVISQKQQEYFRQREETLYTLQSEQARLSAELSKLGPFHLGRKNEIRKALDALSQKLQQLQNPYGEAAALNGYRADAEAAVRAYEEKIQRYLQDRFPKINIPQRTDNEAAAAGRPGNEPLTLEELNDVYEALRNRGIATRQQLMDDVDWYDARRFFQIINALVACYSAEEKRETAGTTEEKEDTAAPAQAETDGASGGADLTAEEAKNALSFAFYDTGAGVVLPVNGRETSGFGARIHPVYGTEGFHSGKDIAAPEGTPVHAAMDGTVIAVGRGSLSGNYVKLSHENGVQTLYCHLRASNVEKGVYVRRGDVIGFVGQTGLATGPHLHFEVMIDGVKRDPDFLLQGAAVVS